MFERYFRRKRYNLPVDIEEISAIFDATYYLASNPDVASSGVEPFEHFLAHGLSEFRNPSASFSMAAYLLRYPDVLQARRNPLIHFIETGRREGRDASPLSDWVASQQRRPVSDSEIEAFFDVEYYCRHNADVSTSGLAPFDHYLRYGLDEHRDPSADFSMETYLANNSDVDAAKINPLIHYIQYGRAEGREAFPANSSDAGNQHALSAHRRTETPSSLNAPSSAAASAVALERDRRTIEAYFDEQFYKNNYGKEIPDAEKPIDHFLRVGWQRGFDPNRHFSVNYYRLMNDEIRKANINPFVHYCARGRDEMREGRFYVDLIDDYRPMVSVIVPNYNHANFLIQRLDSIVNQTYNNIELIFLDDASDDDSIGIFRAYINSKNVRYKEVINKTNSGSVFKQWRKGIEISQGDLIWVCESDDFCDVNFLSRMVRHFADLSVNFAFGNIQFVDSLGSLSPGLDEFRERAERGIWGSIVKRPAKRWFDGAFGVHNVAANVGGCLFRRRRLADSVWKRAIQFKIAGDWYLYSHLMSGGVAVYEPGAKAYFRQHSKNTSGVANRGLDYINEHADIIQHIVSLWAPPRETRLKFIGNLRAEYQALRMDKVYGSFEDRFPIDDILSGRRTSLHVILAFLGFHPGGGEVFPIQLANNLARRGYQVSMLAYNMSAINWEMVRSLNTGIAVYHISDVKRYGHKKFMQAVGASLVHSHMISCDAFLLRGEDDRIEVPYVVTMHGSHDGVGREAYGLLYEIIKGVTFWVYTAEKNLRILSGIPLASSRLKKIPNALTRDLDDFPLSRSDLGIDPESVVFTLVARGIQRKGWRAAVTSFRQLRRRHPQRKMDLVLVGSGDQADRIVADIADNEAIHFLGYQSQINGLYRISDVALVPSRFQGESFPLCVIQALQESLPVIGSDIGEIRSMLTSKNDTAGIVIPNRRDSQEFFDSLTNAMDIMLDTDTREVYRKSARKIAKRFDVDRMLDQYENVYRVAMSQFGKEPTRFDVLA